MSTVMAVSLSPFTLNILDVGKGQAERGMVITVYLDPANKQGSTKERLNRLQEGHFGPFYQPDILP